MVDRIGKGSARPVLSTTSRSKPGTRPRSRRPRRSRIACASSPRMVQQRQPDHGVVDALEQMMVEPDFAEFIDKYRRTSQAGIGQQATQQRRLAGAEKA